jgi:hypothetical protein
MKIDTIRSFPNIDSLFGAPCYFKGRMVIDTLAGTRISSTTGIFDTMYCSEITGDSIKLGSGSILRQYQHSAMACFLNDSTSETYRKTINGHYTRIGNQVTLEIPALLDTIAKSCRIMIWGTFTPDTIQSWVCPIDSSDTNIMGVAIYNNQNVSWFGDTYGYITLYTINGKEIKGSGRTGLPYRMSFTYQLKAGVQ